MFILYLKILVEHFKITSAPQIIAKISKTGIYKISRTIKYEKKHAAPSLNSSVLRILFFKFIFIYPDYSLCFHFFLEG